MFDWIPSTVYTEVHYNILLAIVFIIVIYCLVYDLNDHVGIIIISYLGACYAIFLTLYMGLRPLSGGFGDSWHYARAYQKLQQGSDVIIKKDYVFNYFMAYCSKFMDVKGFFLLCDIIYILPCYLFSKRYFGIYWFFAFFIFVGSFSFWSFGVNGIRNGLGASLFILGLYFYKQKLLMYASFLLSYFMHASLIIPIISLLISGIYKNPKMYIYIWIASIPLSLIGGSVWANLFASLGFAEDRTQGYLVGGEKFQDQFSQTGFRWDFLTYSASAVFAGYYFIFKKNITDRFYIHMFGVYCIANAFWVLVITAAFSNRFAYLSWFLMPAIIAYPMFRYKMWKDQYKTFGIILLIYFMFTYFMNMIK